MMKFIEELLQGAEVEWKPLGEVLTRTRGTKITAGRMKTLHQEGGSVKVFGGGKTVVYLNHEDIPSQDIQTKPSVIVKSRGIIGFEYYDKPFSHKNELWAYHSTRKEIDIKFVYYFLQLHEPYFQGIANRMQMPQIATPDTDHFLIPIPPLSVQRKIVEVLDNFSALSEELAKKLTAELTARQKQYEYYRNQLLSFDKMGGGNLTIVYKALGEVVDYEQPRKYLVTSSEYKEGNPTPVLTAGKTFILGYTDEPEGIYRAGTSPVIIFDDFTTDNKWVDFDFKIKSSAMKLITTKDERVVLLKFIYYWLNTLPPDSKEQGLKRQWISNYSQKLIPIPSLEEQRRIVEVLDRFEVLAHSLTEGLPREIELRQKQYRYYREQLLSFA